MADSTLVLVPGLMCDRAVWSGVMAHLGFKAKGVVVPDHGLCDDIVGMAQQILASVPGALAVAGHSMGGRVALEMRRLAPQRVRHLALLDTGYLARPLGAEGEAEAAKRQTLLDLSVNQGVETMARTWAQGMVNPSRLTDTALMDAIVAMFARRTPQHFAAQIRALLARPDATQTLRSTAGPVYLLCGAQDSWSPVVQHQAMANLLPQAVLSVIESAGHMAPMEQPAMAVLPQPEPKTEIAEPRPVLTITDTPKIEKDIPMAAPTPRVTKVPASIVKTPRPVTGSAGSSIGAVARRLLSCSGLSKRSSSSTAVWISAGVSTRPPRPVLINMAPGCMCARDWWLIKCLLCSLSGQCRLMICDSASSCGKLR